MDELGITSLSYQKFAEGCVENFLRGCGTEGKNHRLANFGNSDIPLEIRVHQNPPSVQIRQMPAGGVEAGRMRISKKIENGEMYEETCDGALLLPKNSLVLADKNDLTREMILLTLADAVTEEMLQQEFITPKEVTEMIAELRRSHADRFILVQRFLLGIEFRDGVKVPYRVVDEKDTETFAYMKHVAALLQ